MNQLRGHSRQSKPGVQFANGTCGQSSPTAPSVRRDVSDRLLTVRQLAERHPAFSEASIRWALWCSRSPGDTRAREIYAGLSTAVIRLGRRVLIDEPKFLSWVRGAQR